MADVVDALVVTLGLDASQFNRAQKEALEQFKQTREASGKTAVEMEASGKKAAEFFSSVKQEALSLMGILLGGKGLESFVRDATTSMAALGREARSIGMSTPELAAWGNAVEREVGGSATAARGTLQKLSDEMENWKITGKSSIAGYLNAIGANPGDSAMDVIRKFSEFSEKTTDPKLARNIGHGLGLDEGSIREALRGHVQLSKDMAESMRLGVPTDEMSERMQQLQKDFIGLQQAAEGVGNRLLNDVEPSMHKVLVVVEDLIVNHPQLAEMFAGLTAGLVVLSGLRLSASVMGLTGITEALTGMLGITARLLLRFSILGMGVGLIYDAIHNKLNVGEQEEIDRENAAHGESHPLGPASGLSNVSPFSAWMREHIIANMAAGPARSALEGQFGQIADVAALRDYFRGQGWSDPQIAGILAQYKAESDFNPTAIGDNGTSAGMMQWHADRRALFQRMFGHDVAQASPLEQAQFTQWELTNTEKASGDALRATNDATAAGALLSKMFVRPKDTDVQAFQRGQSAADLAGRLPSLTVNAGAPSTASVPGVFGGATIDPGLSSLFSTPTQAAQTANNTTNVNIGAVTVHTQATDAKGIAGSIGNALSSNLRLQADRGLN
jgi:hypothetical protein